MPSVLSATTAQTGDMLFRHQRLDARFVPMYEAELAQVWKYIINDAQVKVLFISKKKYTPK